MAVEIPVPWYITPATFDRWVRRETARLGPPTDAEGQKQALIDTFSLCRDNPAFFLHEFGEIKLKAGGRARFDNWTPAQRKLYRTAVQMYASGLPVRLIILKSRQMGVSTLCEGLLLWRTLFFPDATALIVAHEEEAADHLFGICRTFYDAVPEAIRAGLVKANAEEIAFGPPIRSRVLVRSEAPGGSGARSKQGKGRALNYQAAHLSEAAYWADPERFMPGISQGIPDLQHTWVFIESTANAWGDWFHQFWRRASQGWGMAADADTGRPEWRLLDRTASSSGYWPVFLSYLEHPEYRRSLPFAADDVLARAAYIRGLSDEERRLVWTFGAPLEVVEWRRRTITDRCEDDIDVFHREYPLTPEDAFRASGRKVFDMNALVRAEDRILRTGRRPPRYSCEPDGTMHEDDAGPIQVFVPHDPSHVYVLGVDGSYGKPNGDFSCVQVIDKLTREQVAVGHGMLDADATAYLAAGLGRCFHGTDEEGLCTVELDGPGLHILSRMQDLGYWHLYRRIAFDGVGKKPQPSFGWRTSTQARDRMVHALRQAVRQGELVLNDPETIREMMEWVLVTNPESGKAKERPADPTHGHDDRITALGVGYVGGCLDEGIGGLLVSHKVGTPDAKAPHSRNFVVDDNFGLPEAHPVLGDSF